MKKQGRSLLILVLVLVLLVAAFCAIKLINAHRERQAAIASEPVMLGEIGDPVEITYFNGTDTLSFVNEDGTWYYSGDREYNLKQDFMTNIITAVKDLEIVRTIENGASSGEYGLSSPSYKLRVTDADGKVLDLIFGKNTGSYSYVAENGGTDVYAISDKLSSYLKFGLYDMVAKEKIDELSKDTINDMTVTADGYEVSLSMSRKDTEQPALTTDESGQPSITTNILRGYTWSIITASGAQKLRDYVIEGDGSADPVALADEIADALSGISFITCTDYDADDGVLSSCGFDDPYVTVRVDYELDGKNETKTLLLTNVAAEDGKYYGKFEDSKAVYTVNAERVDRIAGAVKAFGIAK